MPGLLTPVLTGFSIKFLSIIQFTVVLWKRVASALFFFLYNLFHSFYFLQVWSGAKFQQMCKNLSKLHDVLFHCYKCKPVLICSSNHKPWLAEGLHVLLDQLKWAFKKGIGWSSGVLVLGQMVVDGIFKICLQYSFWCARSNITFLMPFYPCKDFYLYSLTL